MTILLVTIFRKSYLRASVNVGDNKRIIITRCLELHGLTSVTGAQRSFYSVLAHSIAAHDARCKIFNERLFFSRISFTLFINFVRMNYIEEQKDELEALREIYYNEIEVLSDEPPISFSVRIRTQAFCEAFEPAGGDSDGESDDNDDDDDDDDDEDGEDEGYITIKFDLPTKYPEEKPKIAILASNLDEDDLKNLEKDLDRRAEESLGQVMILTLVSGIDEWFSSRTEDEPEEVEKVEVEEQRVFEGTPVTKETFLAWRRKFDAEMAPKAAAIRSDGRLTGRAMFECDKTLAESDLNFVEDLDQTEIEALMQELSHQDGADGDDEEYIDSEEDDDDEDVDIDDEDLDDEDDC